MARTGRSEVEADGAGSAGVDVDRPGRDEEVSWVLDFINFSCIK